MYIFMYDRTAGRRHCNPNRRKREVQRCNTHRKDAYKKRAMITAGIIAEYNPFHRGHQYHIEETRRQTGADYIVVVMSGDYVQRGEPAAADKYFRARMALAGGADVVLEMPAVYATASAEYFATAGVQILHRLGCVDYLSFGSEWAKTSDMEFLVKILSEEPPLYQDFLKKELKKGKNFPSAREEAVKAYLNRNGREKGVVPGADDGTIWGGESLTRRESLVHILEEPNHILGLEYMKALYRLRSPVRPVAVRRQGAGYHDEDIRQSLPSASAIRHTLRQGKAYAAEREAFLRTAMPVMREEFLALWNKEDRVTWEDLMPLFDYTILMEERPLREYFGFDTEMADRFYRVYRPGMRFGELLSKLHTKRCTDAAWRRALLHRALHMSKQPFLTRAGEIPTPYARLLGFSSEAAPLLKRIRQEGEIPLIQRPVEGRTLLVDREEGRWLFAADMRSARLYEQIAAAKSGRMPVSEWRRQLIIL